MTDGTERVTYAVTDRVAVLTMQHPPVNAVDMEQIGAIHAGLKRADADPDVGAIVLTSAVDGYFCAGMDLKMVQRGGVAAFRRFLETFYLETLDIQHRLTKPTITAINGTALGAGMTLSITSDVLVAADDARLGYPEINVGVLPAIHFAHLPRIAGRHRAFEYLFTGDMLPPESLREIGVLNHVVPVADVLPKAMEIGRKFASKSPAIMAIGRRAFSRANDLDYRRDVANQVEMMCALLGTEDAMEGLTAFTEKRKPSWSGK